MKTPIDLHEPLERYITDALRDQPLRRAPSSLQGRVLAEVERRAVQPWWRKNFAHWPVAARIAFVIAAVVTVKVALTVATWALGDVHALSAWAPEVGWLRTLADAVAAISRNIPSLWLHVIAATLAALYATFFGLGAVAYRTLYASR